MKRCMEKFEMLKNGPVEKMSATPPVFHYPHLLLLAMLISGTAVHELPFMLCLLPLTAHHLFVLSDHLGTCVCGAIVHNVPRLTTHHSVTYWQSLLIFLCPT